MDDPNFTTMKMLGGLNCYEDLHEILDVCLKSDKLNGILSQMQCKLKFRLFFRFREN